MPNVLFFDMVNGERRLVYRDVEARQPEPGEVRYRVFGIGLNRADILYMENGHYLLPTDLPSRMCYEACGVVDAVGEGVTEFRVGDRVTSLPYEKPRNGVAGEYAITPASFLARWPDDFSPEEACSTWMQYLTAYFPLIALGDVGPGDWVLVTAASSSAGIGAIQLAKVCGAKVIASTRTRAKRDALLKIGADHVVASDEQRLSDEILAASGGKGVRVVYDAVGGKFIRQYAEALAHQARVYIYGYLGGDPSIEYPLLPVLRKHAEVHGFSLINYMHDDKARDRAKTFISLAIEAGKLRPVVDRAFPFTQALEAYEYMKRGAQIGKVVLRTDVKA